MRRPFLVLILVGCASASAFAADPVPVVIAVDTSRSLSDDDLVSVRLAIARQLDHFPAETPLGLIAFADQARWLAPIGTDRSELGRALDDLRPEGRHTVLQDALVVASRQLPRGGVVVLVTDGRDENSATTVDDVARQCGAGGVRIVAASLGRRVDERALRRLTLLSNGAYVGPLDTTDPASVVRVVEEMRTGLETVSEPAQLSSPEASSPDTPRPVAQPAADPPSAGWPWWALPTALLSVALLAATLLILTHVRRRARSHCPQCGALLEPWESACSHCQVSEQEEAARTQAVDLTALPDEPDLDPRVFEKAPIPEGLDRTLVVSEQPILLARQRGRPVQSYALSADEEFMVGRAPDVNTLQVDDPTVSAQHFKVVSKDERFYVVDLDTTNGTAVNGEQIRVRKLKPGDLIKIGGIQFEFKTDPTPVI